MKPKARFITVLAGVGAALCLSCETQQPAGPVPSVALNRSAAGPANPCREDREGDRSSAPVTILCAITVPGNPLVSVAKGWTDEENRVYLVDDQSNKGVDIIDTRSYTYAGRVNGFVGVATYGAGTATANGQGPNSLVPTEGRRWWVSDGNSTVQVVDLGSQSIIKSISTAIPACDGGTATTHYCGRVNEMTYDPDDEIILVENPNPLDLTYCTTAGNTCATTAAVSYPTTKPKAIPPYATFIAAEPPYTILGTLSFPDAKGTTEAPVWDHRTHRFLLPVPTCSGAAGATACGTNGATEYIAVINPHSLSVEKTFTIPDCASLMPAVSPAPTGMMNDLSIDERDQHVIMEVCGRGELVFDARTGAVVNVVTEISSTDESWFNPGDGRFYVVAGAPGGQTPGGANTTSLGVIDGRTGKWLQNVLDVGGKIPAASPESNRAFTTVTVPGTPAGKDSTACAQFGFNAFTGCITVFEHEGRTDRPPDLDGKSDRGSE